MVTVAEGTKYLKLSYCTLNVQTSTGNTKVVFFSFRLTKNNFHSLVQESTHLGLNFYLAGFRRCLLVPSWSNSSL